MHFDPLYTAGKSVHCALPVCCQSDSGDPISPADAAGQWGSYGACDTPEITIDATLKFIKANHVSFLNLDRQQFTNPIFNHRKSIIYTIQVT